MGGRLSRIMPKKQLFLVTLFDPSVKIVVNGTALVAAVIWSINKRFEVASSAKMTEKVSRVAVYRH